MSDQQNQGYWHPVTYPATNASDPLPGNMKGIVPKQAWSNDHQINESKRCPCGSNLAENQFRACCNSLYPLYITDGNGEIQPATLAAQLAEMTLDNQRLREALCEIEDRVDHLTHLNAHAHVPKIKQALEKALSTPTPPGLGDRED